MSFSERLLAAWYQGHPALALLRPLEALYRRVANGRRADFLSGRKPAYRAPLPVLVVGNITVGGTGKTPMILWMIEHCRARGLRVGVISRGYGARPPTTPWRVRAEQDAAEAGDEPLMIVRRSGVPLMIDPDRPRALQALLAERLAEPPDLDEMAEQVGLSKYHLLRAFKKATGLSPRQWSMQLRTRRALGLLRRGLAVGEVAHALGFADQSHLTRYFTSAYGISPGRYQRAVRG